MATAFSTIRLLTLLTTTRATHNWAHIRELFNSFQITQVSRKLDLLTFIDDHQLRLTPVDLHTKIMNISLPLHPSLSTRSVAVASLCTLHAITVVSYLKRRLFIFFPSTVIPPCQQSIVAIGTYLFAFSLNFPNMSFCSLLQFHVLTKQLFLFLTVHVEENKIIKCTKTH